MFEEREIFHFELKWNQDEERENENLSIIGYRLQNDRSVQKDFHRSHVGPNRSSWILLTLGRSGSSNLDGKFPPFQWKAKNPIDNVTLAITTKRKNVLNFELKT